MRPVRSLGTLAAVLLVVACRDVTAPDPSPPHVVSDITIGPGVPGVTIGVVQEISSPISGEIYDPCLAEGILFEGVVHTLAATTETPQGFSHLTLVSNFQNVSGTGLSSGDPYRVISTAVKSVLSFDGFGIIPYVYTEMVLGALAGNTAILLFRRHTTINPDGTIAVDYTVEGVRCAPPEDPIVIGSVEP
jgi:hypothetical protein